MPKKKERVRQCFTLDRGFVKRLDNISKETGVPKSRLVENCFGDSDRLDDFEKFCAKREEEGK